MTGDFSATAFWFSLAAVVIVVRICRMLEYVMGGKPWHDTVIDDDDEINPGPSDKSASGAGSETDQESRIAT